MRYYLIILIAFFHSASLQAQGPCPARDVTWASINTIGESRSLTLAQKLDTLRECLNKIKDRSCINDSVHALLLRWIGFVYLDQSDYIRAIGSFRESIQIITSNLGKPAINPRHLISSYYWLSTFYDSLNNVKEKMKAIDSCIAISLQLESSSEISCIRSLETRAGYFFGQGDYYRCVNDAEMCEKLAWTYVASHKDNKYYADAGKQIALTSLGWLVEALVMLTEFKKAENFLGNKLNEYKKTGLDNYVGFVYGQLAQLEIHKGNYDQALAFFNKALRIEERGGHDFICKQILNTMGYDVYFRQYKDAGKALSCYNKALAYSNNEKLKTEDDAIETMEILTRMGKIYVWQGFYDAAFERFQQAFDLMKPGLTEKDVLHISVEELATYKKTYILAGLIIDKGAAFLEKYKQYRKINDAHEAIRIYKVADKLLGMIRATQSDLKSKLFWRSNSRRLYEQAIEACYLLGDADAAFYFFEQSRAVLLNEQLAQHHLLSIEDISNQVQLKKKMLLLERELNTEEAGSVKSLGIQNQLFLDQQNMDWLIQRIKANNPLYYQTVLDTNDIALTDVYNTILKDHQAVLEIFSGDSAVYSLLIKPGKAFLNKINKTAFERTSNKYIEFIKNLDSLNKDFDGYKAISHQLYQLLFQKAPVPNGRIIISPDGRNFPFESLVVNNSSSSPVYFLNDHAVSYTYSARYLLNSFTSNATSSSGNFIGIAPVHFNNQQSSLPGSEQSLSRIASYFGTTHTLFGAKASKNNFTQQFANYSIVQVYTHALANGDTKEPVIYFADSALYLSDLIPEKKPVARLIVLSACETGDGQFYLGEGVFNFNRGFAAYGIPSSITNLWSVDNEATYELTELFYKYLSRDLSIDVALQKAKKEFIDTGIKKKQFPYYWAAAILMGKTAAIDCHRHTWSVPYLIVWGIFFLCVVATIYCVTADGLLFQSVF